MVSNCLAVRRPTCEVHSVIRFLNARKLRPIEIYWQITEVYKWCNMFNDGRKSVHDEKRSSWAPVSKFKGIIERNIQQDRWFKVNGITHSFLEFQEQGQWWTWFEKMCKVGYSNVVRKTQKEASGIQTDLSQQLL